MAGMESTAKTRSVASMGSRRNSIGCIPLPPDDGYCAPRRCTVERIPKYEEGLRSGGLIGSLLNWRPVKTRKAPKM